MCRGWRLQLAAPYTLCKLPLSYARAQADAPAGLQLVEDGAAAEVILDWKGEPMKISPGDKLPFKFL